MRRVSFIIGSVIICALVLLAGADAEKELKSAIKDKKLAQAKKSAEQIARDNNDKAFQSLIQVAKGLAPEDVEYYWAVLGVMPTFSSNDVITKIADYIIKNKSNPISRDLLYSLKPNRSKDIIPLLEVVLHQGSEEMRQIAIDHLSEVYYKDAARILVDILRNVDEKKDWDLVRRVAEALSSVVGQELGARASTWVSWWDANKDKPEVELIKPMKGSATSDGTAVDNLNYVRNTAFNRLKRLPADKIIVVSALPGCCPCDGGQKSGHNFDKIEDILKKFDIPHTVVSKKDFDKDSYKLDDKWFVAINCNYYIPHCVNPKHHAGSKAGGWRSAVCEGEGAHVEGSTKLGGKTVKKIDDFVANGGYFFSEDAVLIEVLEQGFKKALSHTVELEEKIAKIFPAPGGSTHPYLRGVFERRDKPEMPVEGDAASADAGTMSVKIKSNVGKASWKIDGGSPDIKVNNKDTVTVLLVTPSIKSDSKEGAPVAVTFAYTKEGGPTPVISSAGGNSGYSGMSMGQLKGGRVLHVMSHFGKQQSADDEFPLQNLIINFLTELNERKSNDVHKK